MSQRSRTRFTVLRSESHPCDHVGAADPSWVELLVGLSPCLDAWTEQEAGSRARLACIAARVATIEGDPDRDRLLMAALGHGFALTPGCRTEGELEPMDRLQRAVHRYGVFEGYESFIVTTPRSTVKDAVLDLRYDEIFWKRLSRDPHTLAVELAGSEARSRVSGAQVEAIMSVLGPLVAARDDTPAPGELSPAVRSLLAPWFLLAVAAA